MLFLSYLIILLPYQGSCKSDDPYEPVPWSPADPYTIKESSSNDANEMEFLQEILQKDSTNDDDLYEPLPWRPTNRKKNEEPGGNLANAIHYSQEPLQQYSNNYGIYPPDQRYHSNLPRESHRTANPHGFSHHPDSPFKIVKPYHGSSVLDQIRHAQEAREISESYKVNSERPENQHRQAMHYPPFAAPPSQYHRGYHNR